MKISGAAAIQYATGRICTSVHPTHGGLRGPRPHGNTSRSANLSDRLGLCAPALVTDRWYAWPSTTSYALYDGSSTTTTRQCCPRLTGQATLVLRWHTQFDVIRGERRFLRSISLPA